MKSSLSEFVVNSSQLLDINAGNNKHCKIFRPFHIAAIAVKLYVVVTKCKLYFYHSESCGRNDS